MNINENNFISELKNKNQNALEYAVRNYGGTMKAVIHRILYSYPEDAEECLYDTVLKIWEHADSFDPSKSSFSNWAAAVAKYNALDRLRKLTRTEPLLDIDELQISDTEHLTDNDLFNEFFSELISCLNEEDKKIFIRLFWYGETYDEISGKMKKNKSVLFNRVSRGRKKIIKNNPDLFKKLSKRRKYE